jgi:hypothetical protein
MAAAMVAHSARVHARTNFCVRACVRARAYDFMGEGAELVQAPAVDAARRLSLRSPAAPGPHPVRTRPTPGLSPSYSMCMDCR